MLGPSGSGKTTTLRVIAGFERPDEGTSSSAARTSRRCRRTQRDVNTVFQDYALFPHMTVQENVEYGLRVKKVPRRERRRRAAEALALVRLEATAAASPRSSRAASASASRSPARSSTGRRRSCSTSRSARST